MESDEDLVNALKYEELMLKYNEIHKEILETKKNYHKLKTNLNEKNELKKNIINNIESHESIVYLSKHKTDYYNKCIKMLNDKLDICDYFSIEENEDLTKTDFEVIILY